MGEVVEPVSGAEGEEVGGDRVGGAPAGLATVFVHHAARCGLLLASIPQRHRWINTSGEPSWDQCGHEAERDSGGADEEQVTEIRVRGDAGEEVDVPREDVAAGQIGDEVTQLVADAEEEETARESGDNTDERDDAGL